MDLIEFLESVGLAHLGESMLGEGVTLEVLLEANDAELSQLTTKLADKIRLRCALAKFKQQNSFNTSSNLSIDTSSDPVALPERQSILILGPSGTLEGTSLDIVPAQAELETHVHATLDLTTSPEQATLEPATLAQETPLQVTTLEPATSVQATFDEATPVQIIEADTPVQTTLKPATPLQAKSTYSYNQSGSSKSKDISFSFETSSLEDVSKSQLHNVLSKYTRGKLLLEKAKKGLSLTSRDRCYIVSLIVETELQYLQNINQTIRKDVWQKWSDEIKTLFAGESKDLYYVPYHIVGGKVIQASGLIHNRLITHRRSLSSESTSKKHKVDSDSSDSGCSSQNSGSNEPKSKRVRPLPDEFKDSSGHVNYQETLDWLRGSSYPRETLISKWQATFDLRMKILKENSFVEYFNSFPGLKLPIGHELLTSDFEAVYPTANHTFEEKFPLVKVKILKLLTDKAESNKPDDTVLELLDLASDGEEKANIAAVLGIVALLRQMHTITVPKKKLWRLTKEETRSAFLARVASPSEIVTFCTQRVAFNDAKGIPNQPYILAVGPSWQHILTYEIITTAGPRYQVPTICEAIKLTYNLYWALDCAYHKAAFPCWMFIQRAMFDMKSKFDVEGVPLRELLSQLNNI